MNDFADLILRERASLLAEWRQQVKELSSARQLDLPALNDHMPGLLDELARALRVGSDETIAEAVTGKSPVAHGVQREAEAFDIEEIVAEYNILRGCIHDLADRNRLTLQGKPFHILNRVFDAAIGTALQAYSTQRALEIQRKREEYLAFVAHDLRTPLSAISMAARALELSMAPAQGSAATTQMLHALKRNAQHLEALVKKVLAENTNLETETGIKLERREIDLWSLVESLIHDLHPVAGTSSTQLVNEIPEDMTVHADASLLRRIFQNLIANAIRYTPRGAILIGARMLTERIVECSVSDNGSGIPVELLATIFDKGEPGDGEGTGLGLTIVKTFVEAHGGTVGVESNPGAGTTFRFTLPDADAESRSGH